MRIQNNDTAFTVWSNYSSNVTSMKSSMSKLSTGVIRNVDDPAGVGISERMRAQIKATSMARQNTDNAISLLQTADSWMQQVSNQLSRMKALAIEAAGIMSEGDKANVAVEFENLQQEITRVTSGYTAAAKFNGLYLLRGGDGISDMANGDVVDPTKKLTIQIGADVNQTIPVTLVNLDKTNTTPVGEVEYFEVDEQAVSDAKDAYNTALDGAVYGAAAGAANIPNGTTPPAAVGGYVYDKTNLTATRNVYLDSEGRSLAEVAEAALKAGTPGPIQFKYIADPATTAGNEATMTYGTAPNTIQIVASGVETTVVNAPVIDYSKGHWADVKEYHDGNTTAVTDAKTAIATAEKGDYKHENVLWSDVLTNYKIDTPNVVGKLEIAIDYVSKSRAQLAAQQVRIEYTRDGLLAYEDNLTSAESTIRDVDMAKETTEFSKYQVLTQASNAMLAQANKMPENVLQLLG